MASKTTIGLLAAGLALASLAPLAGASTADDTLSRSLPYVRVGGAMAAWPWSPYRGIGWYDDAYPPNVCIIDLFGAHVPVIGSVYYETARVYTNLPGFLAPTRTPALTPLSFTCPASINPLCNVGCAIQVSPVIVQPLAHTVIPQDGLVCTQHSSFVTCIPTAAKWTIAACPWARAAFTTRADGNKGLLGGTGLANGLLSQDINCSSYANAGYDISFLLATFGEYPVVNGFRSFDANPLSSRFDGVSASLMVPFNNGNDDTSYVVQCLAATYTTLDSSVVPPAVGSATEDGVDYELVLDLDGAGTNWASALVKHVSGTGVNGNVALQGLYDLGGDNDCDFPGSAILPECSDGLNNDQVFLSMTDTDLLDNNGCYHQFCALAGALCVDYYDATDNSEAPAP